MWDTIVGLGVVLEDLTGQWAVGTVRPMERLENPMQVVGVHMETQSAAVHK